MISRSAGNYGDTSKDMVCMFGYSIDFNLELGWVLGISKLSGKQRRRKDTVGPYDILHQQT